MPVTADCLNTQSFCGRNLTPLAIAKALNRVGKIGLDPCFDEIANKDIKAEQFYTVLDDGFTQQWETEDILYVNAPGHSFTGGTLDERYYWLHELEKPKAERGPKPKTIKDVCASEWYRKAYDHWKAGDVGTVIGLVYRNASLGSLGMELLSEATLCLTAANAPSPAINGSGRFAFDIVIDGERVPQTSNTQSSTLFCLSRDQLILHNFACEFSQFGVIKY